MFGSPSPTPRLDLLGDLGAAGVFLVGFLVGAVVVIAILRNVTRDTRDNHPPR